MQKQFFNRFRELDFKSFPIFLIILLPPSLVSGPAIPDILITLLSLIFIFISIKEKLINYFLNPLSVLFFIFYLLILISAFFSDLPWISLIERESIFYFRFILFSLAICYFSRLYSNIYLYLAISLFITILVISIDGSVEYFTGTSLFGIQSAETRLFSLFIDEPIVGRYISCATMLCVSLLIYHYGYKNNKIIFWIFSILTIGEVFTFMTGERSAFAMIGSFSLIGLILVTKRRFERIIFVIISVLTVSYLIQNQERTSQRFSQTINELDNNKEFPFLLASPQHKSHYNSAFLMFKDNPILGIGSNLFRHMCDKKEYVTSSNSCTTHPHHYYFQILAENGILGFLIFCFFFMSLVFYLFRHFISLIVQKYVRWRINDRHLLFYIFLFVMLFPLWPSGNFYHNWTSIPLYLGLGFFLNLYIPAKNK